MLAFIVPMLAFIVPMSRYFDNTISCLRRIRLVNALNFNMYKEADNYHVAS
jgi:hypothetical protein